MERKTDSGQSSLARIKGSVRAGGERGGTDFDAPLGVSVNCSSSESISGLGILPPILVASSAASPNDRDDFWKMRSAEMKMRIRLEEESTQTEKGVS